MSVFVTKNAFIFISFNVNILDNFYLSNKVLQSDAVVEKAFEYEICMQTMNNKNLTDLVVEKARTT